MQVAFVRSNRLAISRERHFLALKYVEGDNAFRAVCGLRSEGDRRCCCTFSQFRLTKDSRRIVSIASILLLGVLPSSLRCCCSGFHPC